ETGAGKSILIDALQLVLGARSSLDLLRAGADEAVVEAGFDLPADPGLRRLLEGEGIDVEAGELLVLRRHLFRDGRSKAYVNGRLTTAATLRTLGERLVDIHGQHPGQPLLDPKRHRELLDEYAGLAGLLEGYRQRFQAWRALAAEREALVRAERERAQRQDVLDFQVKEIEAAGLAAGEEEALAAEQGVLANHERLLAAVEYAYGALEASDEAALPRLASAATRVRDAAALDPHLAEVREALETGMIQLQEAARGLRNYLGRAEFSPERLEAVEARLHEIGKLKRKYGGSITEVLEHLERARGERDTLARSEERLQEIEALAASRLRDLGEQARRLSADRHRSAEALRAAILAELRELGMRHAAFQIQVASGPADEDGLGADGVDQVEFLIAPNPGEPLKPLHRIASGGELSRVMLALRAILAEADRIPTLIFDEVDAGIGGAMAEVVGRKLLAASRRHQVLCVTHLPQIACFADHHLAVSKRSHRDRTHTAVEPLPAEARAEELARMLGGGGSEAALRHAEELLESAKRAKRRAKAPA
ncbi:MAG TPA: DNA repair protein RecN, partial [Candidatus Sulfotelmatobacter sp.]|nr:DNA repair protein RecN [Candidatus Sulfotelmatobacter sp.]